MIKTYSTFKHADGNSTVRIYADEFGHFAKIWKDEGMWAVGECDKYGFLINGFVLSGETLREAKKILKDHILNYIV